MNATFESASQSYPRIGQMLEAPEQFIWLGRARKQNKQKSELNQA